MAGMLYNLNFTISKSYLRCHLSPIRMATIMKTTNADEDVGERNPHTLLKGM
jgi:hypothetical protein